MAIFKVWKEQAKNSERYTQVGKASQEELGRNKN